MLRAFLRFLLPIAVSACATIDPPPSIPVNPAARTVAIIPAVPQNLRIAAVGVTVFGNSLDIVDVRSEHLDQVAYEAAAKALAPRYQALHIQPKGPCVDTSSRLTAALGSNSDVELFVKNHASDQPADLYLVFCVSARSRQYTQRPNVYWDFGVSKEWNPFKEFPPVLHTYLLASVVDGRTFKVVTDFPILLEPQRPNKYRRGDWYPVEELEGFKWQDKWVDMTPEQRQLILDKTKALMSDSIGYSVRRTSLGR